MEFSGWITHKYIDWRGDAVGNEKSISQYALLIGVKQPTLSQWMKKGGNKPESKIQIEKLVNFFGYEVYDALGLPRPKSDEISLDQLDPVDAAALSAIRSELAGVDPSTPEGFKRMVKILSEHGIKVFKTIAPDGSSIK
jgi:hypothetical protein